MNEVGVTRQYKDLLGQAQAIPFFRTESYDLDRYVVGKALDGLFHVVGEEERKIRKTPTARTTAATPRGVQPPLGRGGRRSDTRTAAPVCGRAPA